MICPVCNSGMIDVEYERIELDYCTECRGVWFDADELELLFEKLGAGEHGMPLDDVLSLPEAKTSEKGRKCPICSTRMRKAGIGEKNGVMIDACINGDGLWLDGGEVNQLLKQVAAKTSKGSGSQRQVLAFLGEVFKAEK